MSKSKVKQELFSETEVAAMLGVSTKTLGRWRDKGMITWLQMGHKRRYRRSDIDEFLNRFDIHGTSID